MSESTQTPKPAKAVRKRWRRVAIALSVFLVVALGVIFMLPVWACSEQGRQYALEQMNRKLNGTLKIRSWSLGWFSPIRMEGIELDTKEGVPILECEHVQTGLTLWGWWWGNYDLGTTVVSGLRLRTTRYAPGDTDFHRVLYSSPPPAASDIPPPAAKPPAVFENVWNSIRGSVRIEDGHVELAAAGEKIPLQVNDITAEIPIASPVTSIHLTLTGESVAAGKNARLEITGDLPPITAWARDPAAFLRQVTIRAGALPVPALAAWLGLGALAKTGWEDSLGPTVESLSFESKPEGASRAMCMVQMHAAHSDVRARARMDWTGGETVLLLRGEEGNYARATARLGLPVLKLVGYINPMLADGVPGKGTFEGAVNEARWVVGKAGESQAAGLVTLRDLEIRRAGLLGQVEEFNRLEKSTANLPGAVAATVPTMRVTVAMGRVSASPVVVEVAEHPRMMFTGSVGLDGSVDLLMTLPLTEGTGGSGGLGGMTAGTARVGIGGTVEKPEMRWGAAGR